MRVHALSMEYQGPSSGSTEKSLKYVGRGSEGRLKGTLPESKLMSDVSSERAVVVRSQPLGDKDMGVSKPEGKWRQPGPLMCYERNAASTNGTSSSITASPPTRPDKDKHLSADTKW